MSDREKLIELVKRAIADWEHGDVCERIADNLIAHGVTVQKHGRWEKSEDNYFNLNIVKCSLCHEEWCFEVEDDVFDLNYHYCPNCGAKMDGEA